MKGPRPKTPVRVEEAAAIRAEVLDDLERSDRPWRNDLFRSLYGFDNDVRMIVHRSALPNQQNRAEQRSRQQHPHERSDHVDPEIPKWVHIVALQTAS